MNILEIIQNEYISLFAGGIGGIFTAWLTQRILNKRGTFTYTVDHNRVGMSTEDAIFGNVAVTWNEKPISNLYLSNLELKNESMNDYEKVIVRTYTSDTDLLTEQTQILETPNILEHSDKYKEQLFVNEGDTPSETQWKIYNGQREYIIPIFNRGQTIRLSYLNAAKKNETPSIWLAVTQKGVKLKFKPPQNIIFGIPQSRAAFVGLLIGFIFIITLVSFINNSWLIAVGAFSFGLIAQIPGAYAIKATRAIRELIGG